MRYSDREQPPFGALLALRLADPERARRETTLQREIAVKNVSLGIFDPSLGIFDPARCRRNRDFLGGFPPKPRSVLRNRQGVPRLSRASSRACERKTRDVTLARPLVVPATVLLDGLEAECIAIPSEIVQF